MTDNNIDMDMDKCTCDVTKVIPPAQWQQILITYVQYQFIWNLNIAWKTAGMRKNWTLCFIMLCKIRVNCDTRDIY